MAAVQSGLAWLARLRAVPSLDLPGLLPPACGGPVDWFRPRVLPSDDPAACRGLPCWPADLACQPGLPTRAVCFALRHHACLPRATCCASCRCLATSRPRQWTRVDWLQYSRARRRYRDTRTQAVGLQTCAYCFRMRQAAHAPDSRHGGRTGKRAARATTPTSAQLPRAAQLTGTSRAK